MATMSLRVYIPKYECIKRVFLGEILYSNIKITAIIIIKILIIITDISDNKYTKYISKLFTLAQKSSIHYSDY